MRSLSAPRAITAAGNSAKDACCSVIRFRVRAGCEEDFVAAFEAAGMFERPRKVTGFQSAVLLRSVEAAGEFLVLGRWKCVDAYSEWQSRSVSEAPGDALQALKDCLEEELKPGVLYRALLATP